MSDDITKNDIISTFFTIGNVLNADFIEESSVEEIDAQIKEEFSSEIDVEELKDESDCIISNIQNEIHEIEVKKEQIEQSLTTARIKDAGFLEKEIKSMILSSKRVLEVLEKDIKVGAPPRMYEVYATLLGSITSQYKELRNLNESIAKFFIENQKQHLDERKEDNKMMLSSTDALSMYMSAKKDSQVDAIDADFDIVNDV